MESDCSDCCFNEHLHAGVDRVTRSGSLWKEEIERSAGGNQDNAGEEKPEKKIKSVDFNELGERAEDASGLERKVEAEGSGNHHEARDVGLWHRRSGVDLKVRFVAGVGVSELGSGFFEGLTEIEDIEDSLNENHNFEDNRVLTECFTKRPPGLVKKEDLETGSEGEEDVHSSEQSRKSDPQK